MSRGAGPEGLSRPIDPPPDPLLLHRAEPGEPVVGIADLIEWLLVNDARELPRAIVLGIGRLSREGGGIILPAELDALQPTIVPEFEPGRRRGETVGGYASGSRPASAMPPPRTGIKRPDVPT